MSTTPVSAERRIEHYRWMLRGRILEERLGLLYQQGRVAGGVYLGIGQEALSAAIGMSLQVGDVYAPLIRDQAGRLAFGEEAADVLRVHLGKRTSTMRGRDGNVHRGDPRRGLLPMISHLGAMISVVGGLVQARRRGEQPECIGAASIGDGGINAGASSEALNLLALERVPMVLVVANNHYAYSTPNTQSFAVEDIAQRGAGFGWQIHRCDGRDSAACLQTAATAVEAARTTVRPQMIVADLLRLHGHAEHDDGIYMVPERRDADQDCVLRCEAEFRQEGRLDDAGIAAERAAVAEEIAAALTTVEGEEDATPERDDWQSYSDPDGLHRLETQA